MKLKIASTNIRFENPNDGIYDWPSRKPVLIDILKQNSVDIICTQEGREPQLRDLENELNFKIVDANRNWIKERMYPCIMLKKNKFKELDSGDIWLSKTPSTPGSSSFDSAFPRLMSWSLLEYHNQKLYIINTHLDHVLESTRISQTQVLISEVKKLFNKSYPIILCGDFNDPPSKSVYQLLKDDLELYDPWERLNKREQTSFHKFTGENPNGYRIDWILTGHKIKCHQIELINHSVNRIFPSDHFPLIGEFEL